MKKKFSFTKLLVLVAFFKRLTLTTKRRVVCRLSSFLSTNKLICGARNTTKLPQEHDNNNARRLSKDKKYHHVANVREFTFFFFFIYIFIIFEFEKMQKSIFVVVTDKNSS